MKKQSIRSQLVAKRTYNRPLDENGTAFETWEQTVNRVIEHQRWLWERAKGHNTNEDLVELTPAEEHELEELRELLLNYDVAVSGRTFWLGGTPISKEYEATQFNCAGVVNATVHDIVDSFHLLLLGCGVGFDQFVGVLNGFTNPVDIEIIKSTRKDRGVDNNKERFYHRDGKRVWHLTVGDSGVAWAKAAGKILAMKKPVDIVILDFSEIRPGGKPLKGFGWISSGDVQISESFYEICKILSEKHGQLLSRINILDIMNWFGMALSSRRAAEIALCPVDDPEAEEFISAKKDYWTVGKKQRAMSNNTVMFYRRPSKSELRGIFHQMMEAGGSEPGFLNVQAAKKRAPWFATVNPCCEILLGNKSFCNLATIPLNKYNGDYERLKYNSRLIARANYRQTCVDLRDGILQDTWHELNEFLRLTGMSACGVVGWEYHQDANKVKEYADHIREAVHEMADELGLPRSKAITTIKPEGCCFYDTKIKTSLGVVTLDELFNKLDAPEFDSWYSVADKGVFVYDMNNEPQLITKLFNNGVSDTLKITFEDGNFVECTPNHKFYINGNWIRADELVAGLDVTAY